MGHLRLACWLSISFVVAALVSAPSSSAEAQSPPVDAPTVPDASRDREARGLFDAGQEAFEAGRYADALDYFQRAHGLSGRFMLLYNIGVAADRLRRDDEAIAAFERYLREAPATAAKRTEVEGRLRALQSVRAQRPPTTGSVPLVASHPVVPPPVTVPPVTVPPVVPPPVTVPPVGTHPVVPPTVTVPPVGTHLVVPPTVTVPPVGTHPVGTHPVVPPTVTVPPVTVPAPTLTPDQPTIPVVAPTDSDGGGGRIFTWVALGAAVAAGAGGTVVAVLASGDYDGLIKDCAAKGGCTPTEIDDANLGTRALLSNILFGVAGAALVTGGVLFFVEGGGGGSDDVQVAAGMSLGGFVVRGSF